MARGGWKLSEETRRKMSESRKGMRLSEEAKEKLRAARTGKPLSAEHRAKLAAAKIGKPGPWAGKKRGPVSEETRAKMSAAKKGKSPSAEHRAALSAALMGHEVSEETRAKMSASARRGPDHPSWGKPPPHGKRIEHKGHVFRSSYEVRCADALDRKGIKWEYEPRRFDLGDCTYLPDFYLPEHGVYWEVKGWLGPNSQRKINRFRQVHPDIPLVVVTNAVLNLLEK